MYERSYGDRYDEADGHAPNIAKLIRRDIKKEVAEGMLPDRWKYSVRSESFSGGQSINVTVKGCADAWKVCDRRSCPQPWCSAGGIHRELAGAKPHDTLTDEAEVARMTLQRIHGAYNHDGSDSMTDYYDVRYYGQVHFEDPGSADFDQREKARLAEAKRAREAATDRRVVRTYKRDGRSVTHLAVEVDGKLKLVCGARPRFAGDAAEGADVTCSRCAKHQ